MILAPRELSCRLLQALLRRLRPSLDYSVESFAQEGEDMVLRTIFGGKPADYRGFYVDVGAHHPFRLSNTMTFYKDGWRGINIDMMPGSMTAFKKHRPKDINLEVGIGCKRAMQTCHCFDEPALNTFSDETVSSREASGHRVIRRVEVPIMPLVDVLDEYLPKGQQIDFLSVDVEGFEMEVLRSNDWSRYRPQVVIAEMLSTDLVADVTQEDVAAFLIEQGYVIAYKIPRSAFFVDRQSQVISSASD